jgi:DnaJ-domain-containing protein 1
VQTVATNTLTANYYAVLQVHPSAEPEVIEAAYRQLMKRYHPDVAGHDPERIALHHERAKAINQAFSVLRDSEKRRLYDATLQVPVYPSSADFGRPAADREPNTSARVTADAPPRPSTSQTRYVPAEVGNRATSSIWYTPFAFLAAAYYLLPGPYEWDANRHRELRSVFLLPPLGVAGFALSTGRLAPVIGHSPNGTLFAWVLLVLLALPAWSSLFRLAIASVPTLILLSGYLDPYLKQAHLPIWLAGTLFGVLGLVLSARLYVFVVLPTLAVCWLINFIF